MEFFNSALKFGVFFLAILFLVRMADMWLGENGILAASAIAGAASVSAVALSVSELLERTQVSPQVAAQAVVMAIGVNALFKGVLAVINGTGQMAFWLGGGLVTMVATAFVLLLLGQ